MAYGAFFVIFGLPFIGLPHNVENAFFIKLFLLVCGDISLGLLPLVACIGLSLVKVPLCASSVILLDATFKV